MPDCLVVDDSRVVRRVARGMLERLGFMVREAADGAEATAGGVQLAAIGPGHHEHGLARHGDAAHLRPALGVHHQHLVPTDGGQINAASGHGPAAQMRHLEDRQRLLAAADGVKDDPVLHVDPATCS